MTRATPGCVARTTSRRLTGGWSPSWDQYVASAERAEWRRPDSNRRETAYETVLEPDSSPLRGRCRITPGRTRTCDDASTSGRCRRRWATGVGIEAPADTSHKSRGAGGTFSSLSPTRAKVGSGHAGPFCGRRRRLLAGIGRPMTTTFGRLNCGYVSSTGRLRRNPPVVPPNRHGGAAAGRQSARRESNPPIHLGTVVPGPLGHRRVRSELQSPSHRQGRKDSNPLGAGWSRSALPGARPCSSNRQPVHPLPETPAGVEPA